MTPKESERVRASTISLKSSSHGRRRMRQSIGNVEKKRLRHDECGISYSFISSYSRM